MQKREISGEMVEKYKGRFGKGGKDFGKGSETAYLKCRRGVVGGYVDELSADDIAYCNEMMGN